MYHPLLEVEKTIASTESPSARMSPGASTPDWIEDFDEDFYGCNKTVQDSVTVEKASRMYDGQVAFQVKHEHTCGKCLSWKVFLQRGGSKG